MACEREKIGIECILRRECECDACSVIFLELAIWRCACEGRLWIMYAVCGEDSR